MPTSFTPLLGLALPVQGELSGTWGDTVNAAITNLLDTAVAGTTTLSTDSNVTLTSSTGTADQARSAIVVLSGARTATRTVTAPARSKLYVVINATTGGFATQFVGVGPTAGVTVGSGVAALVAWKGTDFVEVGGATAGALTVTGILTTSSAIVEKKVAVAASNIDLSLATVYSKTVTAPITFTVSNVPAVNSVAAFILDLTDGGSSAVTWWANVKWVSGVYPLLTASGRDVLGFFTYDNGATWNGFMLGKDMK